MLLRPPMALLFLPMLLVPSASMSWWTWRSALECCWCRSKSEPCVVSSPNDSVSGKAEGGPVLATSPPIVPAATTWSVVEEDFMRTLSPLLFPRIMGKIDAISVRRTPTPVRRTPARHVLQVGNLFHLRSETTPPITPWLLDKLGLLVQLQVVNESMSSDVYDPMKRGTGEGALLLRRNEAARRLREVVQAERMQTDKPGPTESDQWRHLTLHANNDAFERIFDLMAKVLDEHIAALRGNKLASPLLQFLEKEVVPQLQKERELGRSLRLFRIVREELVVDAERLLTGPVFKGDRWFFEVLQSEEHWATEVGVMHRRSGRRHGHHSIGSCFLCRVYLYCGDGASGISGCCLNNNEHKGHRRIC